MFRCLTAEKIGVVCSLDNAATEAKKIMQGDTLTFTVTYTIGSSLSSSNNYQTMINYRFGINVDGEIEALEVVEDKFMDFLNTTSTYEQLVDALDNKFDGRQEWTSNYIGNVTGSSDDDSMAVNTLFAGQLQITVGDEQHDATVTIKHENPDGNTLIGDDYVSVHVVVFTCDRDESGNTVGGWYKTGSTYVGMANVVTYDGGNGTGAFVTDNWIADAETYRIIDGYSFDIEGESFVHDGYSHRVSSGATIKEIITATDANAQIAL